MNLILLLQKYNVTAEIVMLALVVTILIISKISKPKEYMSYFLTKFGLKASIVAIVLHLYLLWLTVDPQGFSMPKFVTAYYLYAVTYGLLLNIIIAYMTLLSYEKRQQVKTLIKHSIITFLIYMCVVSIPILFNLTLVIGEDGNIRLTGWIFIFECCGMFSALHCLVSGIRSFKSVSRQVAIGTILFGPLDIMLLILQCIVKNEFFVSITYVLPFVIFYCLFHSNSFDIVIGCQNYDALTTVIDRAIDRKKKFAIIQLRLPQIKHREFKDLRDIVEYTASTKCREIEQLKYRSRIYMTTDYVFYHFMYVKNEAEAADIAEKLREILEKPVTYMGVDRYPKYKLSLIYCDSSLKNSTDYMGMFTYLKQNFREDYESEFISAHETDYKEFEKYNEAEKLVLDIRATNDLNDERILCYIQPIYSIEKKEYRTGEALMRMKSGDKMYFPDSFIPAAENNGCIHFLTLAMVNKVCKKIKELEDEGYDFDGITVNCSTTELADIQFHTEIENIVKGYGIEPKHLRLEITESTADLNYDNVKINMDGLIEFGVNFYLDDYGTGYSNLERISDYPFKTIKFDKSILYSALENTKTDLLIQTQIKYFNDVEYSTVVEGVEDEEQFEYCKKIGFDMIQGYYFSKPQPCEMITEYFHKK